MKIKNATVCNTCIAHVPAGDICATSEGEHYLVIWDGQSQTRGYARLEDGRICHMPGNAKVRIVKGYFQEDPAA